MLYLKLWRKVFARNNLFQLGSEDFLRHYVYNNTYMNLESFIGTCICNILWKFNVNYFIFFDNLIQIIFSYPFHQKSVKECFLRILLFRILYLIIHYMSYDLFPVGQPPPLPTILHKGFSKLYKRGGDQIILIVAG